MSEPGPITIKVILDDAAVLAAVREQIRGAGMDVRDVRWNVNACGDRWIEAECAVARVAPPLGPHEPTRGPFGRD